MLTIITEVLNHMGELHNFMQPYKFAYTELNLYFKFESFDIISLHYLFWYAF